MPIANKDLGKYKRPGIFINEIDNSIIDLPVQNVLINLVPGFSKKGPVNKPVYITSRKQFIEIYGDIDRGLERKASYFHRTCIKMLQTGPIWALNLLSTNDSRDKLNWKSISCGAAFDNAATKEMPYSRLFNRQDFWERDDEAFLEYAESSTGWSSDRLLQVTNLGDKTITTFMYKSSITGFDITCEDWYGGNAKVPAYLNSKDWVSDYIVSVLVLEGDWTDYDTLSVDSTWGQYFTTDGLDKNVIQDFVDETNVTTLAYYDASLIPYFKDNTGRDMYIKSLINNDTDKTGLFCAYNESLLLDSDYPTGKMDLIGDGIVGEDTATLDFLSYQETILGSKAYTQTKLDDFGNVFGNYSINLSEEFVSGNGRTGSGTNAYVDASLDATGSTLYKISGCDDNWLYIPYTSTSGATPQIPVNVSPTKDYHKVLEVGDIVFLNKSYGGLSANTPYYIDDMTDGNRRWKLKATIGGDPITIDNTTPPENLYIQQLRFDMTVSDKVFNIGGEQYTFNTGKTEYSFDPLEIGDPLITTVERYDVLYLTAGDDAEVQILKGTQEAGAEPPQFTIDDSIILGYVHHYIESGVTPLTATTDFAILTDYTPISMSDYTAVAPGYVLLDGITMSGYTSNSVNYLKLTFGNTLGTTDLTDYNQIRYRSAYDEIEAGLNDGKGVIINASTGYKKYIENATFTDKSISLNATIVIPIGSDDYTNFYDTGVGTYAWLLYYIDNEFVIGSTSTDRLITTLAPVSDLSGSGQTTLSAGVIGKYSTLYLDYYNGIINNNDYGYVENSGSTKIYLKMWLQNTDKLYIDFVSDTGSSEPITGWDTPSTYNESFTIWSNTSNYKQTLEIEDLNESKLPNNVYEIKVDSIRFSEIGKGDFIEAYYDETAEGDPKKLTRIISAIQDSTNPNWKILKTDAPIKITTITNTEDEPDYQTMVYPQVDVYVDAYKGIKLIPFTIHADSIPNGTDVRQNTILDVVAKTTNLAKGLINKNKISWRYLVDSFGLGLESQSKQVLADLCGQKLNCLGFINAPSVKELKASSNPSFINDDRTLNTAFLMAGGDESKNPSQLYSFAEGVGRSCVGYFFPYVRIDDQGIPKNVPPAAWCASTYMRKFTTSSASIVPWTIAAGISNGRVTDIGGVEMDFTDDDLENLYQMNLNPIVKKRNAGYCINSESTAQVFPFSSLSFLHTREVLIELENSLYDMLLRYQWRFNTPEIRGEIKFRADKICKDLQDRDALYNFRNVIDETNNTNYIIDLQMGVLDTYIEVIKGMGIIVNNITILKKGDIESGGFQ